MSKNTDRSPRLNDMTMTSVVTTSKHQAGLNVSKLPTHTWMAAGLTVNNTTTGQQAVGKPTAVSCLRPRLCHGAMVGDTGLEPVTSTMST